MTGSWLEIASAIYNKTGLLGLIAAFASLALFILVWELVKGVSAGIAAGGLGEWFKGNFPRLRRRDVDFESHVVFDKYALLLQRVNGVSMRCHLRRRLFIRLMCIRLECHRDRLREFAKEDFESMDHDGFKIAVLTMLSQSHAEWTKKASQSVIPVSVMERFSMVTMDMRRLSDVWITSICDSSRFYSNNSQKVCAILDFLASLENCVLGKAEELLSDMNGELSKTEFEGACCTNCDPSCEYQVERIPDFKPPRTLSRVLYVEDDKALSAMVSRMFKKHGVDVLTARTVKDATQVLENDLVDAAILDYALPGGMADLLEPLLERRRLPYLYYTGMDTARRGGPLNTKAVVVPKTLPPQELLRILSNQY